MYSTKHKRGFTLLELSMVLIVIGLMIGGVLVGQELVKAAQARAQIAQIEKFNSAVNTFKVKYGYIPGDIPDPYASQFGFQARGSNPGQGDGNGLLQGYAGGTGYGWVIGIGENAMFWVDLSAARLIDGSFSAASPTSGGGSDITGTNISLYLPQAKIGNGNYVYTWNTNSTPANNAFLNFFTNNYFAISSVNAILNSSDIGEISSSPNITVAQAYAIDKKIDDGLPLSGSVQAIGLDYDPAWSYWTGWGYDILYTASLSGTSLPAFSASCFDNGGNASNVTQYSMTQNKGSGPNCAISFKMQGAAR